MTVRTRSNTRVRSPLTPLEKDVMQAVWDTGRCAVETVHEIVSRRHNLKETSGRTILRRLELKGYLRHEVEAGPICTRPPSLPPVWPPAPSARLSTTFAADPWRN